MPSPYERLKIELGRHGIPFETDEVTPTEVADVIAELELPPRLVHLLADQGPAPDSAVPWVVEELLIFALSQLVEAQDGYRWLAGTRTRLPEWLPNWVVIAAVFGDPFIVDLADPELPVSFARHGAGTWNLKRVAPSVDAFVESLIAFERVLLSDFDQDVWNETGLRPDFIRSVEEELAATLPSSEVSNFAASFE